MIEKVVFGDLSASSCFEYAKKLEFFNKNEHVEFKPGLNIIFAPNGSGKSTILSMIAKATASEQGGVSSITSTWMNDLNLHKDRSTLGEIDVQHDGQPTIYVNSRKAVGLCGGMAAFDDDFFSEGLAETGLRESAGYTTMHRLNKVMNIFLGNVGIPDEYQIKTNREISDVAKRILAPKIPKYQKTIILDEPESGLAIHVQSNVWNLIDRAAKERNLQIIAATHSPFSLVCDAHFIELSDGYKSIAQSEISILHARMELTKKINEITRKKEGKDG